MGKDLDTRLRDVIAPFFRSAADRERAALEFREQERLRVRDDDPEHIADARRELATLQQKLPPRIQDPQPQPPGSVRHAAEARGKVEAQEHAQRLRNLLDRHDGWSRNEITYDNGRIF